MKMKNRVIACLLSIGAIGMQAQSPATNNPFPLGTVTASGATSTPVALGTKQANGTYKGGGWTTGTITLSAVSLTTATFSVLGSADGGNTYFALALNSVATPSTTATTITATTAGLYQVNLAGLDHIEYQTSGTFTATSITLLLSASSNATLGRSGNGTGGSVASVFGRTGAVTAQTGDYSAAQVGAAPVFNVMSSTYGAACNGSTDDTTAIQAAITAAAAVGGQVLIPATSNGCKITSQLNIPLNIQIVGVSSAAGSHIFSTATSGCAVAIFQNSGSNNIQGFVWRDLWLSGTSTGTQVGVCLGGDPAASWAPSTAQGNHIKFQNSQFSGFTTGFLFGSNVYVLDFLSDQFNANTTHFAVASQGSSNSGEHIAFYGGKFSGGVNDFNMQFGGGGQANPGGANFELDLYGTSIDYPSGSMFNGPRLTVHAFGIHAESNTTPFVNCVEATAGTGVCQFDTHGSTFVLYNDSGSPIGTDAPFYSNVFYTNMAIPDGNYVFLNRTQNYLVDWEVSGSSNLATLDLGYPWGLDSNFASFTPPLTNAPSYSFINRQRGIAILQGPNGTQGDYSFMNCDYGDCHWTNADGKITADLGDTNGYTALCVRNSAFATVGCINTQGILYQLIQTIATATTISPIDGINNLTGTTPIATITLPPNFSSTLGGCALFIPASTVATTTAGNVSAIYALVGGKQYTGCYNGSKWFFTGSGI